MLMRDFSSIPKNTMKKDTWKESKKRGGGGGGAKPMGGNNERGDH